MEPLDINIADIIAALGLLTGIVFVAWELIVRNNLKKISND